MTTRRRYLRSARSQPRRAALQAVVGIIALIGSLVVAVPASAVSGAPVAASSASSLTEAATVDSGLVKAAAVVGFNPENIISDALFYDGNAMSAAEIQSFLDSKIGRCENGKCLNVLTASISSRDAWYSQATGDLVCSALQGGTMRVSELIYRVQVACGISAKVILVTLQKEQGLTTSSAPSDWNLRAAMGASCPDTEPCDPAYSGVGPQIVQGVRQLKIYKAGKFAKQPGINFIGYNPNSACGGTNINIQNYATAALYNYTPYQPNAAALAAGWGLGDGCSSYGNRNFYNYYTSWFGSTQVDVTAARASITARWAAAGGAGGVLGPASSEVTCETRGGGCYQNFRSGAISWSSSTGAWETYGGIRARWQTLGFEYGVLGYPVAPPVCGTKDGGCYQNFESGAISWTPSTGSWETYGGIRARWKVLGFENGVLGYPVAPPVCGTKDGGCYQNFQSGAISWTPSTGSWETYGDIRARWSALGYEAGVLGYPVGGVTCGISAGGCYQNFQRGAITWTSQIGAWETYGGIRSRWAAQAYELGTLGYPTAGPVDGSGSVSQTFQGGVISWTAVSGAIASTGSIARRWVELGAAGGVLGTPAGEVVCSSSNGSCYQNFQNGAISSTPATGAWETYGGIRAKWRSTGFEAGVLGYPAGAPVAAGDGVYQTFQNGAIGWTAAAGAFVSSGAIGARWIVLDASGGALGSPISDITCGTKGGGCYQNFENGAISSITGAGTWETYGEIRARWRATGFEGGVLGYPIGAPTCGTKDGGCYQNFQNGAISWTTTTGAWETYGDIRAYWKAQNFENGPLGYPRGAPARDDQGELSQVFQGGKVSVGAKGVMVSP